MSDQELINLSKRGIIASPNESEKQLFQRAKKLQKIESGIDFSSIIAIFQIKPDWVDIEYSNKGLHFWEAACVFENQTKMQLKPIFLKKNYFGYSKEELINHELVHLVRSEFHSSIFEEVLAYQSSKKWRRYLGPIIRNPKESLYFVLFLGVITLLSFWHPFYFIFVILTFLFAFYRLFRTQRIFQKAKQLLPKEIALAILLRLTDEEILAIAKLKKRSIKEYFKKKSHSLRIRQLLLHLLPEYF